MPRTTRFVLALGLLILSVGGSAGSAQSGADRKAALAAGLRAEPQEAKTKAILGVLALKATDRTPEIRSALVSELSRMVNETAVRAKKLDSGQGVVPVDDHGLYLRRVIEALSQDTDPSVIDSLCEVIDTGGLARDGLSKFGAAAVVPVKRIALTHKEPGKVAGAFRVLRQIVTTHTLSPGTRNEIVAAAMSRLSGRQHPIIIGAAAELAVAMGDVGAISRVRTLAVNESQIRAMGISDPTDTAWLRSKLERLLVQK